jgi:hypothetical protein
MLVVDLGKKQCRKDVRNPRRGEGRLTEKVHGAAEEIKEKGAMKGHPTVVVDAREGKAALSVHALTAEDFSQ